MHTDDREQRLRRAVVQIPRPETEIARHVPEPDGRAFVVETDPRLGPLFVTAAHCLDDIPGNMHLVEGLGADPDPTIGVTCLYADHIADIAVLGVPDGEDWEVYRRYFEIQEFREFFATIEPLRIAPNTNLGRRIPAMVLTLAGTWMSCIAVPSPKSVRLEQLAGPIEAGMSGSPILTERGEVIGLISHGSNGVGLPSCLPSWMVAPREGEAILAEPSSWVWWIEKLRRTPTSGPASSSALGIPASDSKPRPD